MPRFPRLYESDLQLEAQKLARLIDELRQQAVLNGETHKLIIDSHKSEYSVLTSKNNRPDRYSPHTRFDRPIHLKDPVTFSAVSTLDQGEGGSRFAGRKITFDKIFGQQFEVEIDSSGFIDLFTVRLNDQKQQLSVSVVNIMGKIIISEETPL